MAEEEAADLAAEWKAARNAVDHLRNARKVDVAMWREHFRDEKRNFCSELKRLEGWRRANYVREKKDWLDDIASGAFFESELGQSWRNAPMDDVHQMMSEIIDFGETDEW